MKKVKLASLLLAGCIFTGMLAACGGTAESGANAQSQRSAPTQQNASSIPAITQELPIAQNVEGLHIGMLVYNFDDTFMEYYHTELERYLTAGGASVTVQNARNEASEQLAQVNALLARGVTALVVNLVEADIAPEISNACHAAAVPVVYVNGIPSAEEISRWEKENLQAAYVGGTAEALGTSLGEAVVSLPLGGDMNSDGTLWYVAILGTPEDEYASTAVAAAAGALRTADIPTGELAILYGNDEQLDAQNLAAQALEQHGMELDVFLCTSAIMAQGVAQAVQSAGRVAGEDIAIVTLGANTQVLEAVQAGAITACVFDDYNAQARIAAEVAVALAGGEGPTEKVNLTGYVRATQNNISEILLLP